MADAEGAELNPELTPELTAAQRHALFDILTHHEAYTEIAGFKWPDAVTSYGFPFTKTTPAGVLAEQSAPTPRSTTTTPFSTAPSTPRVRTPAPPDTGVDSDDEVQAAESTSPLLQGLLRRFVLPLPGAKDLPRAFWAVRVQGLLARLGQAELSESYDKGAMGLRKTLATGASAVIEMVGRGVLGGLRERPGADSAEQEAEEEEHECSKGEELERAWDNVANDIIYGDLMDGLFAHAAKTEDIESYSPEMKLAAEYSIINLASVVHHVFAVSPEGQYLLKLLENVHGLIPYRMVKQTLRIGNAATMISGMMRLLLAKLSVTSLTNWVGLTQNADDGMNLLQRIISLVLSWDATEFKKSADRIEKSRDRPSDEMLQAIRQFISAGRQGHEASRAASEEEEESIITAIFNATNPDLNASMTDATHSQCLEYYSALLSVRDREAISGVLCRQVPDLFTQMVKDGVGAYEPMIRSIHSRVDLREHLESTQGFIEDFIRTSKAKKPTGVALQSLSLGEGKTTQMASVEDYVDLLMRDRGLFYKWMHALAGGCPDVWEEFRVWMKEALSKFRYSQSGSAESAGSSDAEEGIDGKKDDSPTMEVRLDKLFGSAPASSQETLLAAIDAHAEYLATITSISRARLEQIAERDGPEHNDMAGPGIYLSRWQDLMYETPITPATPKGKVRWGRDVRNSMTMGKTGIGDGEAKGHNEVGLEDGPKAPDVQIVVSELGDGFRDIVREMAAM